MLSSVVKREDGAAGRREEQRDAERRAHVWRTSVTDLELEAHPKVIVPSTSVVSVAILGLRVAERQAVPG